MLVSDDLGGEDAGCGGPGLVTGYHWLNMVCGCEAVRYTAKFSETPLETAYGRNYHSIHGQQLWWTFLQSACKLHAPSKLATSVALCCVIKLILTKTHFRVAFYCGQPSGGSTRRPREARASVDMSLAPPC